MLIGVGAVAVVGYLLWKNQQAAAFTNASGTSRIASPKCSSLKRQPQCTQDCATLSLVIGNKCACYVDKTTFDNGHTIAWYKDCNTGENIVVDLS